MNRRFAVALLATAAALVSLTGCYPYALYNGCQFEPFMVGDEVAGTRANCPNMDLSGIDVSNQNLFGMVVPGSDLSDSSFHDSYVLGGVWSDVDFSRAMMVSVDIREVDFPRVDLTDADLTDANMDAVWFSDSIFTGTLVVPASQTVAATSADGAVVTWPEAQSVAGNAEIGPGPCDHPSGSLFPVGVTTVRCDVLSGEEALPYGNYGEFTVTVTP